MCKIERSTTKPKNIEKKKKKKKYSPKREFPILLVIWQLLWRLRDSNWKYIRKINQWVIEGN